LWTQELPALPLFYRVKVAAATIPDLIGFEPDPTEFELWDVELWDTTTTGVLNVAGGEMHSNSGNTKMTFSVGALDEATGLPIDQFDAPVSVTVHYNDVEIADLLEGTLAMYHRTEEPGAEWEPVETQLDTVNNVMTAHLTSFSRFGGMGVAIQQRVYLPLLSK